MKALLSLTLLSALAAPFSGTHAAQIATVNGKALQDDDLRNTLRNFNDGQYQGLISNPISRAEAVQAVVDQELLVQMGEKEGLDKSSEFQKTMNAARRQLLATYMLEKKLGPKLSESALRKYYEDNKIRYSTDQVHVQHILTETRAQAEEVMKKAKEPGADFQKLAETLSRDPSAKNNRGDIGFISRDQFVPEFTDAAFTAETGSVAGPVQTAYGYHVIKVVDRKLGNKLNYEEVELRVKNALQQRLARELLTHLRSGAKVVISKN